MIAGQPKYYYLSFIVTLAQVHFTYLKYGTILWIPIFQMRMLKKKRKTWKGSKISCSALFSLDISKKYELASLLLWCLWEVFKRRATMEVDTPDYCIEREENCLGTFYGKCRIFWNFSWWYWISNMGEVAPCFKQESTDMLQKI